MISGLTIHQSEQLDAALSQRVGILTGGAGTGKSYTLQRYLKSLDGGFSVFAPTGKAASRLNQDLNCHARTIHAGLEPQRNGHDKGGWTFNRNEANPLSASVVVCDECSMVSADIMGSFLSACQTGAQVLLVGDPNQLPPVGHGRPFYDMIKSGQIAHGHLSEVHRYAGRIATVANAVRDGLPWEPSPRLDMEAESPENMRHVEAVNTLHTVQVIETLAERMRVRGYDPIHDIQVLCALNDKGISRKSLNERLQGSLNPGGESREGIPFKTHDKIMCLRNQLRDTYTADGVRDGGKVYLANGEVGRVTGWTVNLKGEAIGVLVDFNGQLVSISRKAIAGDFCLAYACTVHKYQGAQAPVTIVVVDPAASRVVHRSWWYTALTRSRDICFTVGRLSLLKQQCERQEIVDRKTFLQERIHEWAGSVEPVPGLVL